LPAMVVEVGLPIELSLSLDARPPCMPRTKCP
jgi:hypothetical protein